MVPQDPLPGPEDHVERKLTRSTTDHKVWGVAGGLGHYFGIDPVIFRVAFGAATLVSGIGILAYVALRLLLPTDTGEPAWVEGRSRVTTIVVTAGLAIAAVSTLSPTRFLFGPGLFGVAALSVLGLAIYRGWGSGIRDDPAKAVARATLALIATAAALGAATGIGLIAALGGGTAVAAIAIVAGFGLIAAGLLGGPRWLILPVVVLILPLAVVSAADLDLRGGVGDRSFRPHTVADLRPEYKLGVGELDLDLRNVTLPAGTTRVNVRVGMGEARVRVPANACVTTVGEIGVGAADLPERTDEGLNLDFDHSRAVAGRPHLLVKADVGVGHLLVEPALGTTCA
jgi:phage shock protein PspC (stress-responsive transcriptional regulator)